MAEKRKKAKKRNSKKVESNLSSIINSIFLMFLSLLLFVSLLVSNENLENDFNVLQNSNLTFFKIISLDFPEVSNPIGPFGVFFGYSLYLFIGKFFSLLFLFGLLVYCFFSIFYKNRIDLKLKTISFIIFSFFLNLSLLTSQKFYDSNNGWLLKKIFNFLDSIFNHTGTLILSSAFCILSLLVLFEIENVKNFIVMVFNMIFGGIISLLRIAFRIKKKEVKKNHNNKSKRNLPELSDFTEYEEVSEKSEPTIIDHALIGSKNEIQSNKQEIIKNTKDNIKKETVLPEPEIVEPMFEFYVKPDINTFLSSPIKLSKKDREETEEGIKQISAILRDKLAEFGVDSNVKNVNIGPIITQYEIEPAPGIKVSKFQSLSDDLALAIKAKSIRVQAPIPGRGLIGIEVPNVNKDIIYLKDILLSDVMKNDKSAIAIGLGKDIAGNPVISNLAKMPHLLIAGATGAGKSVCINTLINSILLLKTPDEVRMVLIDPKRIELSGYEGIPHLIQNVVTDPDDAFAALNWGVKEMERRYSLLQKYKVRDLIGYNQKVNKLKESEPELEDIVLPYIVIIVDEFADLIMTAGKEVEVPITRLAQMARAIGIHLILATQRPSTKVITGVIKANFPSRIAFQVSSKIDSRVILDSNGAEALLGRGDMLFLPPGMAIPQRIHGAFMSDDEIENLIEYLKLQPKPEYQIEMIESEETDIASFDYDDELFPDAARAVVTSNTASVSMLQRHFKIGYARAGRLIDLLEKSGIVGPHVGSKAREVLSTVEDLKVYGFWNE